MLKEGTPVTTVWGFDKDVPGVITGYYDGGYLVKVYVRGREHNCWREESEVVIDKNAALKAYFND